MKKSDFINLKNNKVAIKYLVESRNGNKSSQRYLYDSLFAHTDRYMYRLWYRFRDVGLTIAEVREEFTYCFMQLLTEFDENIGVYVLQYFNCSLYKRVKAIHKRAKCVTRKRQAASNGKEDDYFSNDFYICELDHDENKKRIDDKELSSIILGPASKVLDDEEKYIFEFLTQSYSLLEISRISKMKYAKCLRKFKTGSSKIRHFLKKIKYDEESKETSSPLEE